MKMAEIARDLNNSDSRVRHHVMRLQEEVSTLRHEINECAKLLVNVVEVLNTVHNVNLKLNTRWERQLRGKPDIEMVESVLPDLDTEH